MSQLIGTGGGAIRYSSHFVEDGKLVLQRACALGLEGIISKASQSVYVSGRGKSWVKAKCSAQQEFVIAGYVPSSTGRKAIGSLVARRLRRQGLAIRRTRRHRLFLRRRRGAVRAARRDARSLESIRQAASPRPKRVRSAIVRPELIARDRFPRLDRRRPPASGVLSGLARRQAGPRDCARDDHGHECRARTSEEQRDADPSRPRLLAGRRRHQGRPRRLLRRSLAVHEALDRRPGAGAGALSGRNRRTDVLPEACLEGAQPQYRPRQRSQGAGAAHQHSRLRRADGAGAVRGARNPSLGVDGHRLGAAGHDRDGPRPRRRRGLDRGHCGGGRGSRPAEKRWVLRRSSRPRAARGCTSSRRSSRKPNGRR